MVSPSADRPTRTPTPAITTRSRGKPMVPRRKARRRANRRYSYRATRSALCIPARALLLLRHHVHKYILERSFSQLKPVQANIFPARQFAENQLGIALRREGEVPRPVTSPDVDHSGKIGKGSFPLLHQGVARELPPDLIHPAVQDCFSPIDQGDPAAEFLHLVHQDGLQAGILVETTILREIADAVLALSGERTAQHFRPSPIRREDVQHHA